MQFRSVFYILFPLVLFRYDTNGYSVGTGNNNSGTTGEAC